MIAFSIPMSPVPKGRPKFTKQGFAYTPAKTREAEKFIKTYIQSLHEPPFAPDVPLHMDIIFYIERPKSTKRLYPTCRADLDNYCKLLIDGCADLWNDDAQIVSLRAAKRYGDPRIEVKIEALQEAQ